MPQTRNSVTVNLFALLFNVKDTENQGRRIILIWLRNATKRGLKMLIFKQLTVNIKNCQNKHEIRVIKTQFN